MAKYMDIIYIIEESVMAGKRTREMDEEAQREFDEANKKGEYIWP